MSKTERESKSLDQTIAVTRAMGLISLAITVTAVLTAIARVVVS